MLMEFLLIFHVLRSHHQNVPQHLRSDSSVRKIEKILLLLVESGSKYCTLWVGY